MHFTIVIPTYNRTEKLEGCLESLLRSSHKDYNIYILADNNDLATKAHVDRHYYHSPLVSTEVMDHQCYVAGCWNWFTANKFDKIKDTMVWLVDDVEVMPDTLKKLDHCFNDNFPNTDGVVGISQRCPGRGDYTWKPYGQVVLGKKFIERYPNHQVCCPSYYHFRQDEEMWMYANMIEKFKLCDTAIINHFHPAFVSHYMDATHKIPRGETQQKDTKTFKERQEKGLIWGVTFELLPHHKQS